MARLTLVKSNVRANTLVPPSLGSSGSTSHRASKTEGEAVKRLLEDQGYRMKRLVKTSNQMEFDCPFHEGVGNGKKTAVNFYVNAESGLYTCHAASCGERGNLQSLERYFGVEQDDTYVSAIQTREDKLRVYERALLEDKRLRAPFYRQGLTDATIERFRLGYDAEWHHDATGKTGRYVIPYLEGRRPVLFRFYQPGETAFKYTWEDGTEATLFNGQDTIGDKNGLVVLCEGELKAMVVVQMGYAACAVPGASMWKPEWQGKFTHAKQIAICFDNDNPIFHIYDRADTGRKCQKCSGSGLEACIGHNPGQDAAMLRVESLGWRTKNILLPLPNAETRKTDINEYFVRDAFTADDFAELLTGKKAAPFKVQTLGEIYLTPPDEAHFLVENGILPAGGRLLIAGAPKVGKSLLVDHLALSLAAGIPFLKQGGFAGFKVDHPTRVLLLDRELSKWSLFNRLQTLVDAKPGYRASFENLLIDHDHLLRLDQKGAYELLHGLVEHNGAEVVIFDTAYKFFGNDVESSSALMKAFEVLDKLILETGVSIVMTHHRRKNYGGGGGNKQQKDVPDPDSVAGSFLWTGWPNATILLNYLNRSVEDPFNALCSFAAFRDAAPPEPLALYRDRESIAYTAIKGYTPPDDDDEGYNTRRKVAYVKPTTETVSDLMLDLAPMTEEDMLHIMAGKFGCSIGTVKPFFLDAISQGNFERTNGRPPIIRFAFDEKADSWEAEHGLPDKTIPIDELLADLDEV
jgi:hypothetical protein